MTDTLQIRWDDFRRKVRAHKLVRFRNGRAEPEDVRAFVTQVETLLTEFSAVLLEIGMYGDENIPGLPSSFVADFRNIINADLKADLLFALTQSALRAADDRRDEKPFNKRAYIHPERPLQ